MPQDINPPLQSRSEKTLANMLDATERLLEDRSFEEISVADIVREASCSNGSFYARFREKSSMLPALYDRYDTLMRAHMEDWLGRCSQPSLSLKSLCKTCVDEISSIFFNKKWLMRAVTLYSRTHADSISPETLKHRSEFQNRLVQVFLLKSNEITHPNPEQAVKYGLFVIASTARDGILFDRSPHALSAAVEFNAIKHELSQMLYAHLTHSESPGIHNNAS